MVVVQGLRKEFVTEAKKGCCKKEADGGIRVAVKNNNFMVMPGDVFGLLGPNGAGKTTTLNMVIAEEGPTAGQVGWLAEEITRTRTSGILFSVLIFGNEACEWLIKFVLHPIAGFTGVL